MINITNNPSSIISSADATELTDWLDDAVLDSDGDLTIPKLSILIPTATDKGVVLKAAENQTANILSVTDNDDVELANISFRGKIRSNVGFKANANQWGDSFAGWTYDSITPEHIISNNGGNYDVTGGTYDNLFTDTTNSPFTLEDATNHNWIIVKSGDYYGAKAEIEDYIDSSNVTLHVISGSWDVDLSSVNYVIRKAPQFIIQDGYTTGVHTGQYGSFQIHNSLGSYLGENLLNIDTTMSPRFFAFRAAWL